MALRCNPPPGLASPKATHQPTHKPQPQMHELCRDSEPGNAISRTAANDQNSRNSLSHSGNGGSKDQGPRADVDEEVVRIHPPSVYRAHTLCCLGLPPGALAKFLVRLRSPTPCMGLTNCPMGPRDSRRRTRRQLGFQIVPLPIRSNFGTSTAPLVYAMNSLP